MGDVLAAGLLLLIFRNFIIAFNICFAYVYDQPLSYA
jgi:hypothetical protein